MILLFLREKGIPVVREAWLSDSIEKEEAQSLDAYDIASDIAVEGKGIPLDKMDPSAEALETVTAEVYTPRPPFHICYLNLGVYVNTVFCLL